MTEKEFYDTLIEKNEEIIKKNRQLLIFSDAIGGSASYSERQRGIDSD